MAQEVVESAREEPTGGVAAPLKGLHLHAGGHVSRDTWLDSKERGERSEDKVAPLAEPPQVAPRRRSGTVVCGRFRVGPSTKVLTEGTVFQPSGLRILEVGPGGSETENLGATGVRGEESLERVRRQDVRSGSGRLTPQGWE